MTEQREPFYLTSPCSTLSFHDNYNILSQIGEPGQYGTAYRCKRQSDGLYFAVKIIDKTKIYNMPSSPLKQSCIKSLKDEIIILKQLSHNYIIKLHDLYETENTIFIIMDECKGGELFEKIIEKQGYKESEAKQIFKQLAEALFYLHTHNIVHSDIKPGNILFTTDTDSSDIKLIDFGFAKKLSPFTSCTQLCGTPYYTAPEVIECNYSHAADMWSLGAVLFTMIFQYPAFYVDINKYQENEETYQIYKLIKQGFDSSIKTGFGAWFPKDIIDAQNISVECMDLISMLMTTDVSKRLSAKEVLQHPWLTGSTQNTDLFGLTLANFAVSHQSKNIIVSLYEDRYKCIRPQYINSLQKRFPNNKMSYEEFETVMFECNKLVISKNEINSMFNQIENGNGYIEFKEVLNAVIYDHLIGQDQKLLKLFDSLKNEDIEKIMQLDDHININNDAESSYDAFLAAIQPKYNVKFNFNVICNGSCLLLINGYMNRLKKEFKFIGISKDICGVIVSFYDATI